MRPDLTVITGDKCARLTRRAEAQAIVEGIDAETLNEAVGAAVTAIHKLRAVKDAATLRVGVRERAERLAESLHAELSGIAALAERRL